MEREVFDRQIWELRLSMLRVAGAILPQPQDIEDAVSTAVVLAYRKLGSLRREESLKPWLLTITVRCCYAQLKKSRREQPMERVEPLSPPLFAPDWKGTLYEALQTLPGDMAQALTLYYYEGMSTGEIAAILRLSRPGVSMRLVRGRARLKEWLTRELDGTGGSAE